jgi:hypothetical protein
LVEAIPCAHIVGAAVSVLNRGQLAEKLGLWPGDAQRRVEAPRLLERVDDGVEEVFTVADVRDIRGR